MNKKLLTVGLLLAFIILPVRVSFAAVVVPGVPEPTCVPVPEWGQTCDDKPVPKNKPVAPVTKIEKSKLSQLFNSLVLGINKIIKGVVDIFR